MTQTVSLDDIALPAPRLASSALGAPPSRGSGSGAEVNAGALVVFGPNMSAVAKSDVSDSLLLAQLAANNALDRYADTAAWFGQVTATLGKIGWISSMSATSASATEQPPFDWPRLAGAAFGKSFAGVAGRMQAAIAAAGRVPPEDAAARLWGTETFAPDRGRGLFLLACADSDAAGSVTLALMAIGFELTLADAPILTWSPGASVSRAAVTLTLDEDVYDRIRSQITTKLGSRTGSEIRPVPL